jgi:hypothetical protein
MSGSMQIHGSVALLNVGTGDTKLTFDKDNPAETIRAQRIVTDMIRRGYALIVEVQEGQFQRVKEFRADTNEYIIADLDPLQAQAADHQETARHEEAEEDQPATPAPAAAAAPAKKTRRYKAIPADGVRGVAIAPTSGG